jgi:hypothetical protein
MKWSLFALVLALVALAAGCSSSGERNRNRDAGKPRVPPTAQQPAG